MIIKMTAIVLETRMMEFKMSRMVSGRSAVVPAPGQPEAARISSETPGQLQMSVQLLAKVGATRLRVSPQERAVTVMILIRLVFMINLLCDYDCIINVANGVGLCVSNHIADKGGDDFGNTDDSKADKGINNGGLGFLDFAGLAGGGDVANTANYYENGGYNTSDANEPLDGVGD